MSFWGILLATIAGMIVGYLWYGPIFGKAWTRLSGFTKEQMDMARAKGMSKTYFYSFLGTLLMAYVLDVLIVDFTSGTGEALRFGFLAWLALIIPAGINAILWGGRNKKLFYIDAGERLVTTLIMVAILAQF